MFGSLKDLKKNHYFNNLSNREIVLMTKNATLEYEIFSVYVSTADSEQSKKVTLNGQEYTVIGKDNINLLSNVNKNYFYNDDLIMEDNNKRSFTIKIK